MLRIHALHGASTTPAAATIQAAQVFHGWQEKNPRAKLYGMSIRHTEAAKIGGIAMSHDNIIYTATITIMYRLPEDAKQAVEFAERHDGALNVVIDGGATA